MRIRLLLLLILLGPLGGCYLLAAARGQLELNARRVPVAALLAAPAPPPELRARLLLASRLRDFASRALDLPDNDSYRYYADIGRPFVVWNVFATPEFSVAARRWCFPVAGCVAYRGYFAERAARAFAQRLEAHGDDVVVGGVPAYSTLGHFADPLLDTVLRWNDAELAALLFHELAHQRLYVAGATAFDEAFATVVEREGVARWLLAEGQPEVLAAYRARQRRYLEVAALVAAARERLRVLYASSLPAPAMRTAKAEEFGRLRAGYTARRDELGSDYDTLFAAPLNNAVLLEFATYQDCVPALEARLDEVGRDLPRFYAALRALGRKGAASACRPAAPAG